MKQCLSGIRVLELGQVLAGPYAGMIMGDLGAEIIKIQSPMEETAPAGLHPISIKGEHLFHGA